MRNLKRVLSLALASVMLMGMMVFGASAADKKTAADLTDMDKVTNKAAVSLLVDLGIIVGKPDGSYAPAETVTRATMAKLITYIVMGDVDPSAFAGTTTDLKDVTGHWAEGYIKYCYANGFIVGDGQGHFMPDQAVTTVSAAKMLLVALGYDAKDRGYEGDSSWSVNIMKDAQKMDLLLNLSVKASDNLSRDNAAQLIYNALFAQTVQSDYSRDINGNKYVSKVTVTTGDANKLGRITYGLTEVKGVLKATSTAALSGTPVAAGYVLVGSGPAVKLSGNVDLLGQQVVYYTNGTGKILSSSVVATGKSVVSTDTAGKAYATYIKDNSLTVATGSIYSDYTALTATLAAPNAGDVVKYIDADGDGTVDYIVRTAYKFAKITKTTAASGSTKATVTVDGAGTYNSDEIEGASDLKKDDLVLVAQIGSTLLVSKPETVEGTISAFKGADGAVTNITVDGTSYKTSNITLNVTGVTNGSSVKTTTTASSLLKSAGKFYLDKAGAVVFYVKTTEGTTSYAYLLNAKKTLAGFGSEGEDTYEAYVILSDGTKATYTLTKGSKFGKDNWNTDTSNTVGVYTPATTNVKNLYKYSVNSDGKMTLVAVANEAFTGTAVKVEKNKAQFLVDDAAVANAYMGKDTTFLFYDASGDGKPVKVITGYDNIPSSTSITPAKIAYVKNDTTNVVEFVFLQTAAVTQSAKAYAYATGAAPTTTSDGVVYEFVVDGAIKNLTLSGTDSDYARDVLFTYTTDNKDISTITLVDVGTGNGDFVKNAEVKAIASNYVILSVGGTDKVVYLSDKYTVDSVLTSSSGVLTKPSVGSLAVGDIICYTTVASGSDAGKLIKAYVVPAPELESVQITQSGNVLTAVLKGARNGTASYTWTGTNIGTPGNVDHATLTATGSVSLSVTYTSRTGIVVTKSVAAATYTYTP